MQSVFRTFFRRAAAGQYDVPEGEELWNLFLVISLNKIRTAGLYHSAAKRVVWATRGAGHGNDTAIIASQQDEASLQTLRWLLEDLLNDLPLAHQQMIELRIAGHDVNDIAAATGRAKRSVERALQQFRQRLGTVIEESTK